MNKVSAIFRRGAPAILFGALLLWVFAEAIFFFNILNYRDTAHFFSRLFELIQGEWSAGRIPLWNPYTNCGTPLLANATSSVFYPGKLVFFLPLPFFLSYNIYVLGHVVLAGVFSFGLAKSWGASVFGAAICALSYAFCGNVIYQYANVIFLVGAAWLPAAIWSTDRMLRERRWRSAIGLGAILAMMVLGGDPQMAYHVGLMAVLYAIFLRAKKTDSKTEENLNERPFFQRSFVLLAIAAICGLILSAIQILPTLEWSRECVRSRHVLPRNLYEVPAYFSQDVRFDQNATVNWYDNLFGKSVDPPPTESIYDYSVAPWRAAEFVWPWISGCSLSQYRRWIHRLAGEPDWVPSMYMGILPFVLAMLALRFRGADTRTKWISLVLALSFVASFGKFGIGWLLRICFGDSTGEVGSSPALGDPFGGLYWFLSIVMPGYAQFRWPAKLLTITAMCASLLAAQGWDNSITGVSGRLKKILMIVAALSAGGFVLALISGPWWESWLSGMRTSEVLGPFDVVGAHRDVLFSFLITTVICSAVVAVLKIVDVRTSWNWQLVLLVIVAVDLGLANGWMVAVTPANQFNHESKLSALIKRAESQKAATRESGLAPYRVFVRSFHPKHWNEVSTPDRFSELNKWAHGVAFPMHHLAAGMELVDVGSDTFHNFDQRLLMLPAPWASPSGQGTTTLQPRRAIDAMNVKYFVLPKSGTEFDRETIGLRNSWRSGRRQLAPSGEALDAALDGDVASRDLGEFEILYNRDYLPRAWIVHEVVAVPPIDRRSFARLSELSSSINFPTQHEFDLRTTAIVESEGFESFSSQPPVTGEIWKCRIARYSPQQIEVEVRLEQPGLMVLGDLYEKNWIATDVVNGESKSLEIVRTNRIMRGVRLDAGDHKIVFRYVPMRFYFGAILSLIGWIAVVSIAIRNRCSKRRTASDNDQPGGGPKSA